jgi:hypothetical protein
MVAAQFSGKLTIGLKKMGEKFDQRFATIIK